MYYLTIASTVSGPIILVELLIFLCIRGLSRHFLWLVKITWWVHMLISYSNIILGLFTCLSGLYTYMTNLKYLMYVHWAGFAYAFICLEILHCFRKKNRWFGVWLNLNKVKNVWTLDRFFSEVNRGKKYALFDDCVVDLTLYVHPGGNFYL